MRDNWQVALLQEWFEKTLNELESTTSRVSAEDLKQTLKDFNYRCAYCQVGPWQSFDHFYPKARGGRTRIGNLLPSCLACNHKKDDLLPDKFLNQATFEKLKKYLESKDTTEESEHYFVTFAQETKKLEKRELFRNVDEANLRLQTLQRVGFGKDDPIRVISFGVEYYVRNIILGVPEKEQNVFTHCIFECENSAFQIYKMGASKEFLEDYLRTLRTYCIIKNVIIDWRKLK